MEIRCSQRCDCVEQMRRASLAQERSEQSSWRLEEGPDSLRGGARVWAFGSSRKSVVHPQPLHSIKTNPGLSAAPVS